MKRKRLVISGLVICLALGLLGYVVYTLLESSLDYYQTVTELKEKGESIYGQGVRVNGDVVPGSIEFDNTSITLTFVIADEFETLDVSYEGTMPDNFGDETQVVLEGKLDSIDSMLIFQASKIITKCPSKYEATE